MRKEVRKLAILSSGKSSAIQAVIDAVPEGVLLSDIAVLISDNKKDFSLRSASIAGIDTYVLMKKTEEERDNEMCEVLKNADVDLVVSVGYLKKIGHDVLENFTVINTHQSLLPKYGGKGMYGIHVHEAVVNGKEQESGATVHFVDEEYCEGQIIWQTTVPVYPDDTKDDVQRRVQAAEGPQLVSIIRAIEEGKIDIPNQ